MSDLGDTLRFSSDAFDNAGALTNAQAVSLTITLPDGTTATPSVTNPPAVTGKYFYDYTTTTASPEGLYLGKWLFTFAGGATTSYEESFEVGKSLVTVGAAIAHLRAAGIITSDADLEQLQWLSFVATEAVELDLDRVLTPRTVTETHDGGGAVILRKSPVISITSVTENGSALTDYLVNTSAGILYRGSNYSPRPFQCGFQNVVVTYRAGYNSPPRVARKVALNLIQGAWQVSQQAPHPALTEFSEQDVFVAQAALSQVERAAYDSLRSVGIA